MEYLAFVFLIRTISTDVFLIKPLMEIDLSQRHSSAVEAEAYRLLEVLFRQRFSCRHPHNDSTHSNSSQCRLGFRLHSIQREKGFFFVVVVVVLWIRIPSASYYSLVILTQIYLSRGNCCCSFLSLNPFVWARESCVCAFLRKTSSGFFSGRGWGKKKRRELSNIWSKMRALW